MNRAENYMRRFVKGCLAAVIALFLTGLGQNAFARPNIRQAFFVVYPDAVGSVLDTLPSQASHCGVCHYDFTGGGLRNLYGARLEVVLPDFPDTPTGRQQAILSIQEEDPDGDAFSTVIELTDLVAYVNTPTFPGLAPGNVGKVSNVNLEEIENFLVPSQTGDVTPPSVEVLAPNGGEVLAANSATTVTWVATDENGVIFIDLFVSDDGGVSFRLAAPGLPPTGSYTWYPPNRPTIQAVFRVVAVDAALNSGFDDSDAVFEIESPPGGLLPTTLRDFDMPGAQPFEAGTINPPAACSSCHGNFDAEVEPFFTWQGGMMAHASVDPLFEAAMVIANQDAPDSGDMCLRCHTPAGWVAGRAVPPDGSQLEQFDRMGVSCDFCHRLVDIFYDADENPREDEGILAGLTMPPSEFGNAMYVLDPTGLRRGPYDDADIGHDVRFSPFHREAALCGTCHDVSNPAFEMDKQGDYVPNTFDEAAADVTVQLLMPIQRTYSEWLFSDYNTPEGVFAPEFAGNLDPPFVSTCQDCHMRDVVGQGCFFGPERDDLPLHDLTGGSTWMLGLMDQIADDNADPAALQAGIQRTRYMLQNASEMTIDHDDTQLHVTITNNTGHKLPTGTTDGRRMWINVRFLDAGMALISESGAYDPATGILTQDPQIKVYQAKNGLDDAAAALTGLDAGPSSHLILNNKVFQDNRIPPRGFNNATFAAFGGEPVGQTYEDGEFWDITTYIIPDGAVSAEVTLFYQSTTKEYVEFLRDENVTDSKGQEMFDLWNDNDKAPPEVMESLIIALVEVKCPADFDGDGSVGAFDLASLLASWGPCPGCPADLNGDGSVGAFDLASLLASWGPCP